MKELICIVCPRGCHLSVDEENLKVSGNSCPRGEAYGISEVTNPTRVITSTVKIKNTSISRLPVKTDKPISKKLIFKVMELLDNVEIIDHVKRGDVILKNILDTDVNIIACRDL